METIETLTAPEPTPAAPCDDAELAARFRAGQAGAFDQIVAAHQPRIVRLVGRLLDGSYLDGADDVDDIVQEVFLAVFTNLGRFRGECKLSTWLTTIAVNKCRSRRRLRRLLPWPPRIVAVQGEPSAKLEADEQHAQVRRAVERLKPKYREPIVLRYFQQMPVPEIGQVLGISTGAVEVRLSRARGRLKEILSVWLEKEPK